MQTPAASLSVVTMYSCGLQWLCYGKLSRLKLQRSFLLLHHQALAALCLTWSASVVQKLTSVKPLVTPGSRGRQCDHTETH